MEQVSKFRTALFNAASKELNAFDRALREELAKRDELHVSEIKDLQKNIRFLQQQASRATELEDELHQIRAHQADICTDDPVKSSSSKDREQADTTQLDKPPDDQRHVSIEVYEECHQRFLSCSLELERVKEALEILKLEAKRWKLAYRMVHHPTLRQAPKSSRQHPENAPRPNSAPIERPAVQEGLVEVKATDPRNGLSANRSSMLATVEERHALPDLSGWPKLDFYGQTLEKPKQSSILTPAGASEPPSNGRQDNSGTDSSDVPEQHIPQVRWDSEDGGSKLSFRKISQSKAPETDSDIPVVVSERSLKRKRGKSPVKASERPKSIKKETLSSSPIAPNTSIIAKGMQESIDLDEISNPLYTPRKDQRKRLRMRGALSSTPPVGDSLDTHQINNLPFENTDEPVEEHGHELYDSDAEARDEAYFRRKGEEYAAQLWAHEKWRREEGRHTKPRRHNAREVAKRRIAKLPENNSPHHQSISAQSGSARKHVLQPTNANKALPRTHDHPTNERKAIDPSSWHHGAQYIQGLAEDGESDPDTENMPIGNGRQNSDRRLRASSNNLASSKPLDPQAQQRLHQ
ncbi:MAG: hypothetical protein Q9225_003903, partial [Loekoesia sp. 1 TL-2023]